MSSQKGRVLTLVVEFTDDTYPQWIMDAHMKEPQNGVKVKSISEGDVPVKYEELADAACTACLSFDRSDNLETVLEKQGII